MSAAVSPYIDRRFALSVGHRSEAVRSCAEKARAAKRPLRRPLRVPGPCLV